MVNDELKRSFHHLIDSIDNETMLQYFYDIILKQQSNKNDALWNSLSKEDKSILLQSYQESFDNQILIANEEMKSKYSKHGSSDKVDTIS